MITNGTPNREFERIVLTGATSMIGIALIDECIKNRIFVLAIVNPKSSNINRIPISEYVNITECKLENVNVLTVPDDKYDVFYHLGWTGTDKTLRLNVDEQTKNISYTLEAVRLAKRLGCHTFVGAGSQAEFGRADVPKISPNYPVNPEIAYGAAKYAAGRLSAILCEQLSIRHIWTRIFSVYGPYDNESTLVMYCINSFLKEKVPALSNSEQTWDYLFSEDAGRALYLTGKYGKNHSTYCIGSGEAAPLIEYIEIIRDYIDPNLKIGIGQIPYSSNQVMNLCADISSLKNDTGFVPQNDFADGIKKTVQYIKRRAHNDNSAIDNKVMWED